jgi:predicted NodU family carbamoyl transferase
LAKEFNIPNLCMAGGVALNCVANGKILRDRAFKDIWVQPASGDAGGALGGALAVWYTELNMPRVVNPNDSMKGSYLGPLYERQEKIDRALGTYERLEKIADELPPEILAVMASIYHMKGLDDKAIKYAENAFASAPDSWKVNHLLGTIHLDQKHIDHQSNMPV